jgi:hypothetical protein
MIDILPSRTPQLHAQASHSPAVTIVSRLAHHGDNLVNRGRICRVTALL